MAVSPRDVCIGFFDDVNSGRFAQAFDRLAPDVVYEVVAPAPYGGTFDRDGLGATAAKTIAKLAEALKVTIKGVTAEGERVAIETESYARAISGMIYNNRYHFLFVVRDEVIVEAREYLDSAHYKQLMDG